MKPALAEMQHLVLRRDLAEIARMAAWIDEQARILKLSDGMVFRLQLCLEEAISNIVRHEVVPEGSEEIRLSLGERQGRVTAWIEDQGQAFDPLQVSPPEPATSIADAKPGGLGIHLMRQFATRIEYQRFGSRNRLVMEFAPS